MTADPGPTPDRAEPSTDYDDPAYYEPHGLKPQCTYIVHWHSCRLDAGHSGRHSPGRIEAEARASAPEQGEPPADDENSGYVSELIEHDRAASGAQAVPPLDVERLLHAAIEREKRGTIRYAEDIGHDMGMAHAQDIIRRECAALHPENGPQSEREHAAWCYLPKDHPGMCEGDQ